MQGNVFNIQRFTIHDGPGVRTEIFLKGCPLRCRWCSNPESWAIHSQPGIYRTKCVGRRHCGLCEKVCPKVDVVCFYRNKIQSIDRERCENCMECAEVCPGDSIKYWGKPMTVEACMAEIRKDKGYYERSGGGVTVSGGEPLMQSDFVRALFQACHEEGIHTCCESTFHGRWEEIEKILPYTDLLISDIKHMDTAVHKEYTGVGNERILENLKRLAGGDIPLILRVPVIPGVNDDMDNMRATADFIENELGGRIRTLQLLSFMRLGEEKYKSLGLPYGMADVHVQRKSFTRHVEELAEYMNQRGIHCMVGTRERE